jgi:hypothetical protein
MVWSASMRTHLVLAGSLLWLMAGASLTVSRAAEGLARPPIPTPSTSMTTSAPLATLKFKQRGGLVMLPVTVNGSAPLSFLFDTGYAIDTIHPDLADSLQLRRAGKVTIVGIAGEEDAPTYAGTDVRLGDVTYSPRRVAAVPSEAQRRRRRDGILGGGLLRRYVVQLNFTSATARIYDPASFASVNPTGNVLTLRFRQDTPSVTATIPLADGKTITGQFEVDTGCDDGVCVGKEFVAAHDLARVFGGGENPDVKQGVGGEARIRTGRIPRLRLGQEEGPAAAEAVNVSASFFEDGSPAGRGMAGHIGMDAWRQFLVTFDYPRQRILLEPLRHP